jgi:hypothetical protein
MTHDITKGAPPIIGRRLSIAEWLTYVASYDFGRLPPDRLVLHHTWKPTETDWKGERSVLALQRFYKGKGWTAGPHIFAAPDGIWLFTPLCDVGIHAGSGNSGNRNGRLAWYSVGLEMVGNFDVVRPSGAVWENAKAVMGGLCKRFGKSPEQAISFHRDYSTKTCPGTAVTKPWVFAEVNAWLNPPRKLTPFVVSSPIGTNIHQGPALHFPVAGYMGDRLPFEGIIVPGELFEGDTRWVWVSTGQGFVPFKRAKKVG